MEQYFAAENLNVDNVVMISIDESVANESFYEKYNIFRKKIDDCKYIEYKHYGSGTFPFLRSSDFFKEDSLLVNNRKYPFYVRKSDANFQKIFQVEMLQGAWFKDEVMEDGTYPVVLTKSLVDSLKFQRILGAKLSYQGRTFTVTGVMNDIKASTYSKKMPSAFFAYSAFGGRTGDELLKIKRGQIDDFTNYFWKEAQKDFPEKEGYNYNLIRVDDISKNENANVFIQLSMMLVPAFFLTIFAFLGTFSLMYRQSKRSICEYGVRMALGSTKSKLKQLVIKQSAFLTLCAVIAGFLIYFHIHLILFSNEVKFGKIVIPLITVTILLFVFALASAWYPAYIASKTQPAIAVKQEE